MIDEEVFTQLNIRHFLLWLPWICTVGIVVPLTPALLFMNVPMQHNDGVRPITIPERLFFVPGLIIGYVILGNFLGEFCLERVAISPEGDILLRNWRGRSLLIKAGEVKNYKFHVYPSGSYSRYSLRVAAGRFGFRQSISNFERLLERLNELGMVID